MKGDTGSPSNSPSRISFYQLGVGIVALAAMVMGISLGGYSYNETISEVTCLACLGLNPYNELEYSFETVNGAPHPDWVTEPLGDKVVLIDFTQRKGTGCAGCDEMAPVISELEREYEEEVEFIIVYMFENDEREDTYGIYSDGKIIGVPTFIIVTLDEDDDGTVKPYFGKMSSVVPKHELSEQLDAAVAMHLNYRFKYTS